jgi:hypothetical protein
MYLEFFAASTSHVSAPYRYSQSHLSAPLDLNIKIQEQVYDPSRLSYCMIHLPCASADAKLPTLTNLLLIIKVVGYHLQLLKPVCLFHRPMKNPVAGKQAGLLPGSWITSRA